MTSIEAFQTIIANTLGRTPNFIEEVQATRTTITGRMDALNELKRKQAILEEGQLTDQSQAYIALRSIFAHIRTPDTQGIVPLCYGSLLGVYDNGKLSADVILASTEEVSVNTHNALVDQVTHAAPAVWPRPFKYAHMPRFSMDELRKEITAYESRSCLSSWQMVCAAHVLASEPLFPDQAEAANSMRSEIMRLADFSHDFRRILLQHVPDVSARLKAGYQVVGSD